MWNLMKMIEEHSDRLHAFIRSRVSGDEDSWDILQDVFTALTARWNLGVALEDGAAWLFRVTRNKIVDHYRRSNNREISLDELPGFEEIDGVIDLIDPEAATPEEEHNRRELRQVLLETIEALPPAQREVFLLTEIKGIKFADIAKATGEPLGTLLARKRYAVLKLKEAIADFNETWKGE